jgi:retrograde regulation protein 2
VSERLDCKSAYQSHSEQHASNGIRFSITDLSAPTARILPTLYMYRLGISLYDAQFDRETRKQIPIPDEVVADVIAGILRFRAVCEDFEVDEEHIRILATEATRKAMNSEYFRTQIKEKTGLEVTTLSMEEEGNVGAMGIASSFNSVRGLVMDLGGGSAQVTWIISEKGLVRTSPRIAVSLPYGAAAITRRLAECDSSPSPKKAREELRQEIRETFLRAYGELEVPQELVDDAIRDGGFHIYLSGGGFRGWGYLLLSVSEKNGQPYPISIINGFEAGKEEFIDTEKLKEVARNAEKIFRVSDRRRQQVPAVAFLVHALTNTLPHRASVARFCQGGVREGFLFRDLPQKIRAQDPIAMATALWAPTSAVDLKNLFVAALPQPTEDKCVPATITAALLQSFANLMFVHAPLSKESASVAALYCTSTGYLAAAHGLSHSNRARLALILQNRWDGELAPRDQLFKQRLFDLLTAEEVWWCLYIGIVGWLVGEVYPAGAIPRKPRMALSSSWATNLGRKGTKEGVHLRVSIPKQGQDHLTQRKMLEGDLKRVAKVGKKKNWVGGRHGWGMAVGVTLREGL